LHSVQPISEDSKEEEISGMLDEITIENKQNLCQIRPA
jgi:hypothetical protein